MLIFISIAVAAFIIVAGSFVFGHDIDHDTDTGHDFGDTGGHTIGIFSTKVMGTMLMGFGAAGAIARVYGLGYLTSSLIGVLFGCVLGAVMFAFVELIGKQQASSVSNAKTAVNATGYVTVSIGENELGEVGVTSGGQYLSYPARSKNGKAIAKGKEVRIVEAAGGQVTVEEIGNQ